MFLDPCVLKLNNITLFFFIYGVGLIFYAIILIFIVFAYYEQAFISTSAFFVDCQWLKFGTGATLEPQSPLKLIDRILGRIKRLSIIFLLILIPKLLIFFPYRSGSLIQRGMFPPMLVLIPLARPDKIIKLM